MIGSRWRNGSYYFGKPFDNPTYYSHWNYPCPQSIESDSWLKEREKGYIPTHLG